jgi:hypothetical protein
MHVYYLCIPAEAKTHRKGKNSSQMGFSKNKIKI